MRAIAHVSLVLSLAVSPAAAQCRLERILSPSTDAVAFGSSVAINDRHLIICDRRDLTEAFAFAYRRTADGNWELRQTLAPVSGAMAGAPVVLDGDRAIITAVGSRACPFGAGIPYVFEFDGAEWRQTGRLCPLETTTGGWHGTRLALHGDMAIAGMAGEDVVVYLRTGDVWEATLELSSPHSPTVRSDFGYSMDLNARWAVIGAPLEQVIEPNGGAAYIFRRLPGGELELAQKLIAPDILTAPRFGESVAMSDDTLAVGGYLSDRTYENQGAVYIYELVADEWRLTQELTHADPAEGDLFGTALALDGNTLAVLASRDSTTRSSTNVFLFERGPSGVWELTMDLPPVEPAGGYGAGLALGGGFVVIGAPDTLVKDVVRGAVDVIDLTRSCCRPDLDGDGALTFFDYLEFQRLFATGDRLADFDGDGELTVLDFLYFQSDFWAGCL